MKTLYLECAMGAAGDMLMAALYELCPEKEQFLTKMNALVPGVSVEAEPVLRQGIAGTHMRVRICGQEENHDHEHDHEHHHDHDHDHDHEHHHDHTHEHDHEHHDHDHEHHHDHDHQHHHEHHTLADIEQTIDGFSLSRQVKDQAKAAYALIAGAESRAHGVEVGQVHFHEVGALDAVVDVTGVCYLMELLGAEQVLGSPVTVGSGTVRTAHGLLPVPAPATAHLLEGVPVAAGDIAAELCTPTGAALLRTFAAGFGPMPAGRILGCGCGCGSKDFPRANCLRAFLLETEAAAGVANDLVTELEANMDDMTGEALGFAMEQLLAAGALDVSYLPLQMKKNRPGVLLKCLCRPADGDRLAAEILRHTTTFGVRRTDCARYALQVEKAAVETAFGPVTGKTGRGYGVTKVKAEYDEAAALAAQRGIPLAEVLADFARRQ